MVDENVPPWMRSRAQQRPVPPQQYPVVPQQQQQYPQQYPQPPQQQPLQRPPQQQGYPQQYPQQGGYPQQRFPAEPGAAAGVQTVPSMGQRPVMGPGPQQYPQQYPQQFPQQYPPQYAQGVPQVSKGVMTPKMKGVLKVFIVLAVVTLLAFLASGIYYYVKFVK